jgi:Lamin Tail Domain/Secretion system C-terminal sorting domain
MKKLLLVFGLISSAAFAQDCSKIFISEYVEGWGNNKALEIYNPTNTTINLSEYFVARYSNGSSTATVANAIQLSGTIAPYDVLVAALDKRVDTATGQEAPIWDSLEVRADIFLCPDYNVSNTFYWNGNDAVLLAKGNLSGKPANTLINAANIPNFAIIDVFGKIGENPADATGSSAGNAGAWSTQFPYNAGTGVLITQDHSMIRKSTILAGVTTNPSFFNGLAEYDTIPAVTILTDVNGDTIMGGSGNPILFGNWFTLGSHDCNCTPLSVDEVKQVEMSIYPNPTNDGVIYVKNATEIKSVSIYNSLGQLVQSFNTNAATNLTLKLGDNRGVYIVRFNQTDGNSITKRVVVK